MLKDMSLPDKRTVAKKAAVYDLKLKVIYTAGCRAEEREAMKQDNMDVAGAEA